MVIKSRKFQDRVGAFDIVNAILLSAIALTMLYPFFNLLVISLSSVQDLVNSGGFMLYPKHISLDGYKYVFQYKELFYAYKITIIITVVGTIINLVLTAIGAYILSNREMPGRNFLMSMVIITMFFNGGMIPSYIVVSKLHLVNSLWSLMIPGAINTFNLILMRNFFQTLPLSLKESARIDGASEVRILVQIMIPLSMPIVATLALFYGVAHWNEYSQAIIYISDPKIKPLQVFIRSMYEQSNTIEMNLDNAIPPPAETVRSATIMIATVPIMCVYPFLQKYFVSGMMVGSIKG